MRVFGIDFTSAPRAAKPITCAVCELAAGKLVVEELHSWSSFAGFEAFLATPGRWTAAIDFPFGQPRQLIQALGWPEQWSEYVRLVGSLTKLEFVELIDHYREQQPVGDKHHLRASDKCAGSCSPMMLYGVPVGKMFFAGAPRLLEADVSIVPCRPNNTGRTVIEGYPALVARNLVGDKKYKSEQVNGSDRSGVRAQMLQRCQIGALRIAYGISLRCTADIRQRVIADTKGDLLDAVMCAVQAAAFHLPHCRNASIPPSADAVEGWIADPTYDY